MVEAPDKDRLWTRLLGLTGHVLSASVLTGSALDGGAELRGLAHRADLRVGDIAATGLAPASVTAVLCVDAGFRDVRAHSREDWLAEKRAAWCAVVDLPPSDDPAMQSLQSEGRRVLERGDPFRQVLATGRRP